MNLVIDASVAFKWIVAEEQEDAAEALLLHGIRRIAPDFLVVEVGNVLRTKIMNGLVDPLQAKAGLRFVRESIDQFVSDGALVDRALEIAADLNHAIYDCLYIACAEHTQGQLVTADRRLMRKLEGSPYQGVVQALAS